MAKKLKTVDIWKKMKPQALLRLALAAFLMFSLLGLVSILIESSVRLYAWNFVAVQAVAVGGMAASIVFVRGRWWATILVIAFWCAVIVMNGSGLSFIYNDGEGLRVRLGGMQQVDSTQARGDQSLVITQSELDAVYTQRGVIGAVAIVILALGYTVFVGVIKNEVKHRARFETEVQIARDIQMSLLPPLSLETAFCSVSGVTIPASEVGGDYYDFVNIKGGQTALTIADVTGHGVGAGILSAMVKSALRLQLESDPEPIAVLTNLNKTLYDVSDEKTFVTFAYTLIDPSQGSISLITAGHPPGLYRSGSSRTVTAVRSKNPALGMQRGTQFADMQKMACGPADLLILYTDGLMEATNSKGEQFGEIRLLQVVADLEGSSEQMCGIIVDELRKFCGREVFEDDVSVLCLQII